MKKIAWEEQVPINMYHLFKEQVFKKGYFLNHNIENTKMSIYTHSK